jgi:hypothetical protein
MNGAPEPAANGPATILCHAVALRESVLLRVSVRRSHG